MDCPITISTSPNGPREGEYIPYSCPIVYCPPVTSGGGIKGNFTYFMCVKYFDDINPDNIQFYKKSCETNSAICDSSCENNNMNNDLARLVTEINRNYTMYVSGGCVQGDQTTIQNKSSIFPISSQFSTELYPTRPTKSSTSQNQATLLIPSLLMLLLVINFIQRKI